jgi:hypothetical protein
MEDVNAEGQEYWASEKITHTHIKEVRFLGNVSITTNQTFLIDFFVNWLTNRQMVNEKERENKLQPVHNY